ncbi:DUF1565 domain-containing protein [Candidatus Bathyarchaeota archaeon]|nr:DUF1565 domain-containing protein [Candidatus Bathyarchaeota archaeon]
MKAIFLSCLRKQDKKNVSNMFLLLFCLSLVFTIAYIAYDTSTSAFPDLPVANVRTGLRYETIQLAIDANATLNGDTLMVNEGVYYEHVNVNKSLTIVGENCSTTVVDSGGYYRGFIISANNVILTGFTVQNARWAIYLNSNENCIYGNRVRHSDVGIYLESANQSLIANNLAEDMNLYGECIYLKNAKGNVIQRNTLENATYGVSFASSQCNLLKENTVANCYCAFSLGSSSNNTFYHNNILNSTFDVETYYSRNMWNSSYPKGGNYWSRYKGTDQYSGTMQDLEDSDGIGDKTYNISADDVDAYPLIAPINVFDAGTWNESSYTIDIISNSTISNFSFNPAEGPFLRFSVTAQNQSSGFCRVTLPKNLLWTENGWNVTVNATPVEYSSITDEHYTFLYFTYAGNTGVIEVRGTVVIPELSLSFSIFTVLTAVAFYAAKCAREKHFLHKY